MREVAAPPVASTSGVNVRAELNRFRQKLLDLSNSNRLLNYRKSATRTIQIIDELPNQIFDRLVLKEKPFSFRPKEEPENEDNRSNVLANGLIDRPTQNSQGDLQSHELPDHPEDGAPIAKHHADDRLQTDLSEKALDRILNVMRQEAQAAIEETGVNYLYLALGMLEWGEKDGGERAFQAPLMLIPLRFDRSFDGRSNKYRVTASYTGEDIQQNLCLAKRIETDFGILLPEYGNEDDGSPLLPEEYFARVAVAIVAKPEWRIKREALIGFFSFRKLLMYLDLDPERWKGEKSPENHPLVRAVIEGSNIEESPHFFGKDYDIDEHPLAQRIALVKDADSSQHSALCDIAEGKNLVIEGPPGTGKSQTITNAIANALNDGQGVLFVAEKLAALEVVRRNLEKVGLGAFCLELHSEKANSREAFADLGRRLDASFVAPRGLEALRSRVEAQKTKLRKYLLACGLPAGPHGKPLYELFWRITELRSRGAKILQVDSLETSIDELGFDEALGCLRELAAHAKELGSPGASAWKGFFANQLPPGGQRAVAETLGRMNDMSASILAEASQIASRFGGEVGGWVALSATLPDDLSAKLSIPPGGDATLTKFITSASMCDLAITAAAEIDAANTALKAAKTLVADELPDAAPMAEVLAKQISPSVPKALRGATLGEVRAIRSQVASALQAFESFTRFFQQLTDLGFGVVSTLRDFEAALYKYRLVSHDAVKPPKVVSETLFSAGAPATFQRGRKATQALQQKLAAIEEHVYLTKTPADGELEECIDVLRAFGSSWTRFFRSQYRRTRKRVRAFLRPIAWRLPNATLINVLKDVLQFRRASQQLAGDEELRRYFGDEFCGIETDWKAIELSLSWATTAKKTGLSFGQAVALVRSRWDNPTAPSPSDVIAAGTSLRQELTQSGVSQVLGLATGSLEVAPLTKLYVYVSGVARLIDQLNEARHEFVAVDATTLDDLINHASQVLGALADAERLNCNDGYKQAFPQHYRGIETDSAALASTATWIRMLLEMQLPEAAIGWLSQDESDAERAAFCRQIERLKRLNTDWSTARGSLSRFGTVAPDWLTLPGPSSDAAFGELLNRLQQELPHLPPWASFCRAMDRCRALGLRHFADAVYEGRLEPGEAADAYDLTLHEQIAAEILDGSEPLRSFSRHAADQVRAEFQELDRQLIKLTQESIAHRAAQRHVPLGNSTGRVAELTELGLIRHEVGKQRRHCRIRDLIHRAGRAVQALKPCFMMSPLSIAQYLPAGQLEFDLVVMDEASQIKPEDALGTLMRAKQIVIVGDPKQLPPTSFFDRMTESDENEESTFLDDTESVLEVSLKAFPHRRRLRWHYRSQHESLIAFSNEKFYDGDLIVFPSPTSAAGRLGVRWHSVEGAEFVGGCNPVEANIIAEAIVKHALEHPSETLGVAAFNAKQAQAIRDRLDEITSQSSEARLALERLNEQVDNLFIKNLENVQGDERDVIFISFTYGPDPATKVVMNRFGPMTGEHGWRRLNVLITRARRRVEVFTSMTPADIKGGPDKNRGVNAMKDYLHYAMTGQLVDRGTGSCREPDSHFEISVARVVESLGLRVVPQVGVAGYFVDLGVLHPSSPGDFLLGIECDGAMYHSSKSARDRDRLREEVITARGWKLHRIWSTDWFLNQEAEEERLQAVIRREIVRHGL